MLLFQNVLTVFSLSLLIGMCLNGTREIFIREYKRYRQELGCDAPLCSDIQQEIIDTYKNGTHANSSTSSCCSSCSCDKDCERLGDCCPDKLTKFPSFSYYPVGGIFECRPARVKEEPNLSRGRKKLISKCTPSNNDSVVEQKCLAPIPEDLEGYRIASHKVTKEAYRNINCAKCNNVSRDEVIIWDIKIQCMQGIFIPQNMSEIISEVKTSENCNIIFEPPSGFDPPSCKAQISQCNITGLWQTNSTPVLEHACGAFESEFRSKDLIYKNSLCYICNTNDYLSHKCMGKTGEAANRIVISFSALLDFREQSPQTRLSEDEDCTEKELYDYYKGICRQIICPPMTVFFNNSCNRIIHLTNGLLYEATIKLSTAQPVHGQKMLSNIRRYFAGVIKRCTGEVSFRVKQEELLNGTITDNGFNSNIFVVFISFKDDFAFVDVLLGFDGSVINIENEEGNEFQPVYNFNRNQTVEFGILKSTYVTFTYEILYDEKHAYFSHSGLSFISGTIPVSKFLQCQMIELDLATFQTSSNTSGIFMKKLNLLLRKKDFIQMNTSKIRVCATDYIPASRQYAAQVDSSVKSILTLVFICISIVCLVITLVVYGLLPELRTQPGMNNIFLSVSLLLAFSCLIIGGLRAVQGLWCTLVGLVNHFLWINSMLWLNVCCFHMFRTFGSFRLPVHKKTSWHYHAYCLIISTILVNTNIIWSMCKSDGASIGYGKHSMMCYMTYSPMIAYTMTLPISAIVVSNFGMYTMVVYWIKRNSFTPSSHKNREFFSMYIKLSTITGVSWSTYLPVYFIGNGICDKIFSVLVACQGIFIMLAFVCNRRVFRLLKTLIGKEDTQPKSTEETRSKASKQTKSDTNTRDTTSSVV